MNGRVKRWLVSLAHGLSCSPLRALLPLFSNGSPHLLRVLTYHRVDWPDARPDLSAVTLSATPSDFAAQMEYVAARFRVVHLNDVLKAVASGGQLPPWSVLLTFDDAYCDFRTHAWPVLRRLDFPATVFVPTAYASQPERAFWWDQLHAAVAQLDSDSWLDTRWGKIRGSSTGGRRAIEASLAARLSRIPHQEALDEVERMAASVNAQIPRPAVMGWHELSELAREGVTFAAHTRSHPRMNGIPLAQAREEAIASRDDLREHLGQVLPAFAYPGGAYDNHIVRMLGEEGFQLAFTTCRGTNDLLHCPPLLLRRINVGLRTTPEILGTELALAAACLNAFYPLRSPA